METLGEIYQGMKYARINAEKHSLRADFKMIIFLLEVVGQNNKHFQNKTNGEIKRYTNI